MYRHVKLFNLLRVTVAYRFKGGMLLDKLACGAAGNRRQACHLNFRGFAKWTAFITTIQYGPRDRPYHIDSVLMSSPGTASNNIM